MEYLLRKGEYFTFRSKIFPFFRDISLYQTAACKIRFKTPGAMGFCTPESRSYGLRSMGADLGQTVHSANGNRSF